VANGQVWFLVENARFYVLDVQHGHPVARFSDIELNLNTQGLSQRPVAIGSHILMPAGLAVFGFDVPEGAP
jgi:hypothetical protein